MLSNRFKLFLLGILVFVSGCSSSGGKPLTQGLTDFGKTIYTTLFTGTPYVTIGLMFFAMVVGTFAMFKGLLRFAFKKDFSDSTFGPKEINVIALMLSIIGSTGIFYVFRDSPPTMISYIGGSVGLLFVLFICVLIMRFFIDAAKSFEDSEGALGKGPAWIFIFTLGAIFSLFLLLGYAGQILKSLGCKIAKETGNAVCAGGVGDYNLFFVIFNNGSTIIGWLLLIALGFGIFWLVKANKKEDDSSGSGDSGSASGISLAKEEAENGKTAGEAKSLLNNVTSSLNSARDAVKDKEAALADLQNAFRGKK